MLLLVSPRPLAGADVSLELAGPQIRPRSPKVPCAAGAGLPDAAAEDGVPGDAVPDVEDEHAAVTPDTHASATDNAPMRLSMHVPVEFILPFLSWECLSNWPSQDRSG
jgi:hypothetical protein